MKKVLILFIGYWILSVLVSQIDSNTKLFKENKIASIVKKVFMPNYRMFAKPPNIEIWAEYNYYKKGALIDSLNTERYLKEHIKKENLFFSEHRLYKSLLLNSYDLSEKYNFDSHKLWYKGKEVNPKTYYDSLGKKEKRYVESLWWFGKKVGSDKMIDFDSIEMKIYRRPYELTYDTNRENEYSVWTGKVLMVEIRQEYK